LAALSFCLNDHRRISFYRLPAATEEIDVTRREFAKSNWPSAQESVERLERDRLERHAAIAQTLKDAGATRLFPPKLDLGSAQKKEAAPRTPDPAYPPGRPARKNYDRTQPLGPMIQARVPACVNRN